MPIYRMITDRNGEAFLEPIVYQPKYKRAYIPFFERTPPMSIPGKLARGVARPNKETRAKWKAERLAARRTELFEQVYPHVRATVTGVNAGAKMCQELLSLINMPLNPLGKKVIKILKRRIDDKKAVKEAVAETWRIVDEIVAATKKA